MNIRRICVLGGTGFVGSALLTRLHADGYQLRALTRHRARHRHLLVLPNLRLIEGDAHDPDTLRRAFEGMDAVVNLVGILNERGHGGRGFRRVHTELAQKVLEACKGAGVKRLLHMSALHADAATGRSHYLRSKGEAENHVHTFAGEVKVTSFRPSVIFGPGDSFVNRFARLLRLSPLPVFPLTCAQARFQPVYVGDVVEAMAGALEDPASFGRRYDLCGPRVYTLREIVEYVAQVLGLRRRVIALPDALSRLIALGSEYTVKFFSLDNYYSLQVDSVCAEGHAACPTPMEAVVPRQLGRLGREAMYHRLRARAGGGPM